MNEEKEKYIAQEIWNKGWFQAFLDNKEYIPDNMVADWNKMQALSRVLQRRVDKLLEDYPHKGIFE